MRIVISHVYSSHNNGDAAILSAQIDGLKEAFVNPELHIFTIDKVKRDSTFEGVPVCNALMYGSVSSENGRLKKLVLALVMMVYTAGWAYISRTCGIMMSLLPRGWREPIRLLVDADMQVCVGGGYLRGKKDLSSSIILLLLFHQIWLAHKLGKPVYLYAQSFGPYPTRIQRRIAMTGLRCADLILVREGESKTLLTDLGLTDERVIQVPDSAFAFNPNRSLISRPALLSEPCRGPIVGVTVRSWLPGPEQSAYELAMAQFIDAISAQCDFNVVVIPQVTSVEKDDDDRVVGRRIQNLITDGSNIRFLDERFTHHEIGTIYSNLDYLVGTRFHSVIFALSAGVPALAIEYEHKTSGIMKDLGLERWVLPIEAVTCDKLLSLFELLVRESESYIQELQEVIPDYVESAREGSSLIAAAFGRSQHEPMSVCA